MSDELDVLKSVTAQLDKAGIPYMVTGSMAGNFYAVPRMTRDIDLVIELSERDVDRVTHLFLQEYYIDRDMVQRAVRDHAMFNMIHTALVVKVGCVVRKETEYRPRRVCASPGGLCRRPAGFHPVVRRSHPLQAGLGQGEPVPDTTG